jgi:protein involved in polysaccharide export with SLBB domain
MPHRSRATVFLFALTTLFCAAKMARAQEQSAPVRAPEIVSSAAIAASTNSMEVLDDKHKLVIGDRLSYRVVEERKPPVQVVVTDAGEVELPLIGRVAATGKTCRELAQDARRPLERDYFYKATVIVSLDMQSRRSPGRIYISGYVRSQGPLEMPPDETLTLSKAILRAGGIAQFGNGSHVKVTRKKPDGTSEKFEIDYEAIIQKGRTEKDIEMKPDDTIVVPRKIINI